MVHKSSLHPAGRKLYVSNSTSLGSVTSSAALQSAQCEFIKNTTTQLRKVSVIGFNKLTDPNYNKAGKAAWCLVLLVSTGICLHLTTSHILRYFSYPIERKVTHESKEYVSFPVITICPSLTQFLLQTFALLIHNHDDNVTTASFSKWNNIFEELNITITEYWNMLGISHDAVTLHIPCDAVSSTCIGTIGRPVEVENKTVDTMWGHCLMISLSYPLPYRGPFTYLKLQVDVQKGVAMAIARKTGKNTSLAKHIMREVELDFTSGSYNSKAEKFGAMFKYVNAKNKPCTTWKAAVDCWNACTDRELERVTKCKLPYMKTSRWPTCNVGENAFQTYKGTYEVFSQAGFQQCGCPRTCNKYQYTVNIDRIFRSFSPNATTDITIIYEDNDEAKVEEIYSYNLPMLYSDIGGVLGLFMGVCALTLVEAFEAFGSFVRQCLFDKKKATR